MTRRTVYRFRVASRRLRLWRCCGNHFSVHVGYRVWRWERDVTVIDADEYEAALNDPAVAALYARANAYAARFAVGERATKGESE